MHAFKAAVDCPPWRRGMLWAHPRPRCECDSPSLEGIVIPRLGAANLVSNNCRWVTQLLVGAEMREPRPALVHFWQKHTIVFNCGEALALPRDLGTAAHG